MFWRCPAGLWGPSTPSPTWVAGQSPHFVKLAGFLNMYMEMGWICPMWPSMPSATNGHRCAQSMPFGSPPHQGLDICGFSQVGFLWPFQGLSGCFFVVCVLLARFRRFGPDGVSWPVGCQQSRTHRASLMCQKLGCVTDQVRFFSTAEPPTPTPTPLPLWPAGLGS